MLTQQQIRDSFNYFDGHLYWKEYRKGCRNKNEHGYVAGYIDGGGYKLIEIDGVVCSEHRLVFMLFNGYCPKLIDHIDGNKSNNSIENLRQATHNQNSWNTKFFSTNTSGKKGVYYRKDRNVWIAKIGYFNQSIYLGYFKSKELAEEFTDLARSMIHGEFANNGLKGA